jgi:DNA-binding NarL/FixJ family response regulator
MINIVIAEDHIMVRQGLRLLLETEQDFRIMGEAGDGPEGLRLAESLKPDVLITDLRMGGMDGIQLTRRVRACSPHTKIVILTMHSEPSLARQAMLTGASAFVVKDSAIDELIQAVRSAAAGGQYLSPSVREPGSRSL